MTPLVGALAVFLASWPSVVDMHTGVRVHDASKAAINLRIKVRGRPGGYLLKCRSGDFEDPEFDWSGNLQCRLLPIPDEDLDNLLAECPTDAKQWDNRGRFLKEEVVGPCASYPEFGARRSFRLRSMKLTLELRDIDLLRAQQTGGLGAYTLGVQVTTDPSADSRCASRPTVPNPLVPDAFAPGGWRLTCATSPAAK